MVIRFSLEDYLFVSVKLSKNAGLNKYSYSGYSIGFNSCSPFFTSRF